MATQQQRSSAEEHLQQDDISEEGWMRIDEGKWSEPLVAIALRRHHSRVVLPMGAIATSLALWAVLEG